MAVWEVWVVTVPIFQVRSTVILCSVPTACTSTVATLTGPTAFTAISAYLFVVLLVDEPNKIKYKLLNKKRIAQELWVILFVCIYLQ